MQGRPPAAVRDVGSGTSGWAGGTEASREAREAPLPSGAPTGPARHPHPSRPPSLPRCAPHLIRMEQRGVLLADRGRPRKALARRFGKLESRAAGGRLHVTASPGRPAALRRARCGLFRKWTRLKNNLFEY